MNLFINIYIYIYILNFCFLVISENPLYIRGHSQSVLNKALNSDTEFLASQLVMDYSLLVGIDEETSQLIVGIIGNSKQVSTVSSDID